MKEVKNKVKIKSNTFTFRKKINKKIIKVEKKNTNWQPTFTYVRIPIMNALNILRYKILQVQFLSDLKKIVFEIFKRANMNREKYK